MNNDIVHGPHVSAAQRKNALIAQGAAYRAGITASQHAIQTNLHLDGLAIRAVQHAAARSTALLGTLLSLNSLRKGNLRAAVPLVTAAVSLLAKRGAAAPMLRGAAVLAAVGGAAFFLIRKKRGKPPAAAGQ